MGRFAYLGHLAMITVPVGSVIAGLNLGALVYQLENLFPIKWVPDSRRAQACAGKPSGWACGWGPIMTKMLSCRRLLSGIFLTAFNALSAQGFFQALTTIPQVTDKSTMSAHVAQKLCITALEPFSGANENNTTAWIQSSHNKLAQMECPQRSGLQRFPSALHTTQVPGATSGMKITPRKIGTPSSRTSWQDL
ncbi:hypothetical protein DSO57_1007368 [Entomophthora muscae]|uniref:Uncharacterized protein n=1 Tax=Entomophthora muscae TaxID=34485 RepID=A0ACC2RYK7_9FUNG|nr:hypothetical protein DSO57_1007368 [Entomophthora muscae]